MDKGFDEKYGARPLRRTIEHYVEDAVVDALLEHKLSEGQKIVFDVDVKLDQLKFIVTKAKKLVCKPKNTTI